MLPTISVQTNKHKNKNRERHYIICDTAWEGLQEQAAEYYPYVRKNPHAQTPGKHMVSRYLTEIASSCTFVDNRPEYMQELDYERLSKGNYPYWYWEERGYKHTLSLSIPVQEFYVELAQELGITRENWSGNMLGTTKNINHCATIFNVIGLGWLKPERKIK